MRILILGGTGFLGSFLSKKMASLGFDVDVFTRQNITSKFYISKFIREIKYDDKYEVLVNLAGENLSSGRWTELKKKEILESRINSTRKLQNIALNLTQKPKLIINASAIGYYGHSEKIEFTEEREAIEGSFSHALCKQWESEFYNMNFADARKITIRTGVVLEKNHGALARMLPLFKFNLGSIISSGTQYFSWIHIDDFCNAIIFLIHNKNIEGPINLTSPHPVTNKEFTTTLAKTLNKRLIFDTPAFILKIIYGEMAEELLIKGQNVKPKKLLDNGFNFNYPKLELALNNIFEVKK
jgi:uncharacterized protein